MNALGIAVQWTKPQLAKWRRLGISAAALIALDMMSVTMARSQIVWQMSTEYPRSNISGLGLTNFAELVSTRTGGLISVEVSFESHIGSGELMQAATNKLVTGGDAFAGPMEMADPVFGLASLPFVIQSIAAAQDVNAKARNAYDKALAQRGLKLLYITIWPPTGLWSDRALNVREDLRSLVLRTYDYQSARVMEIAGAKAEYLPFREAIEKVEQHQLNGILTSGDGGAARSLWNVLTHFTAINYAIPISIAYIRADVFEALSSHIQGEVLAAARDVEQSQLDLLESRTEANYRRMRGNGVTISDPAPRELVQHLRDSAKPVVSAWRNQVSAEVAQILDEALLH